MTNDRERVEAKAIGQVSIAKAPRPKGNASQHMDEAIERVVDPEITSQEAREVSKMQRLKR